jgi:hypothetical protein
MKNKLFLPAGTSTGLVFMLLQFFFMPAAIFRLAHKNHNTGYQEV